MLLGAIHVRLEKKVPKVNTSMDSSYSTIWKSFVKFVEMKYRLDTMEIVKEAAFTT